MTTTIDTAGHRFYTDTVGQGVAGPVYIRSIKWVSDQGAAMAADNDFLLSDTAGNRIIGKRGEFIGDDLNDGIYNPGIPSDGFVVTTMDSGVCYITFDRA